MLSLGLASVGYAQSDEAVQAELKQLKQEVKEQHSHFYISIYGGLPFTVNGDMNTFADGKTYFGYTGGGLLGYQFSPLFGISLTGQYGKMPAGVKSYEHDFVLLPSGLVEYAPHNFKNGTTFDKLRSNIEFATAGLHFDFNIAPLLKSGSRRFAIVLSPAVYAQKFRPVVSTIADNKRYASALKNPINLGVGGDVDIRYAASRLIDVFLKGGVSWINNENFDGIDNPASYYHHALMGHATLGVSFKLGGKDKKDNIMYAPTARALRAEAQERVNARLAEEARLAQEKAEADRLAREKAEADRLAREKAEAERLAREKAAAQEAAAREAALREAIANLPAVHFVRGSAYVNKAKYAKELQALTSFLKENPNVSIELVGFCDATGTERVNDKLSQQRADRVKTYLVEQGIEASRISTSGNGVDTTLTGNDAYSVKARRVEAK